MNELTFFLLHHHRLYFEKGGLLHRIEDLVDDQIISRPNNLNSIAWLLWHIARCEDVGINRLVCECPQVIDEENWFERLNIFHRDIGTGMTTESVTELSSKINVDELRKYVLQVAQRTQAVIPDVNPDELDIIPDSSYLNQVLFNEGALNQSSRHVADHYSGKTKGWFLGHLGLTHGRGHLGQIIIIRKLVGLGSGGL
jgi:hypothetical protein